MMTANVAHLEAHYLHAGVTVADHDHYHHHDVTVSSHKPHAVTTATRPILRQACR